MGDFFQLPLNGGVDHGMVMSVQIRPDRRVCIQVLPVIRIPQQRPFSPHDHDRSAREPIAHLRERMPDELVIELGELTHDKARARASQHLRPSAQH